MPRSSSAVVSEARRAAAMRDAEIGDIDWTVKAPGAVASRFAAPSGELAVVSLGDPAKPRVVLVPGATGSKEDFVLMLPVLARAGYFVQAVDLTAQYESGRAGPPPEQPYTYDLFVNDLVSFLEAGAAAHLLGYSFAGTLAQSIAVQRPELVRSLALLATPPGSGNVFTRMKWAGAVAPFANARTGAALMVWGIMTNKNRVPPKRLEFVRSRFAYTDRRSIDDIVGLMMDTPDLRDAVRRLPMPKLVAVGTHDLWSLRLHERFARELGAELRTYEAGHSPCETTPHQLCLDLLGLYARADG